VYFVARALAAKLEPLARQKSIAYEIAVIYSALGEKEKDTAFSWLDRAFRERSAWRSSIKIDPRLDGIRMDPRYGGYLRKAGLAAPEKNTGPL
jgi:hypothetical protein